MNNIKIEFNKSNDNPFKGLEHCLKLFQNVSGNITEPLLNNCWNEVKNNITHKQMFFSLLFSIGDITGRQHNIFKGKKTDSGGNANRDGFEIILKWMWTNHTSQFMKFLNAGLFNEYTCFDALLKNRVKTKGSKVIQVYNLFSDNTYREVIANYLYKVIKGNNPYNKTLIAKFLSLPRLSKRCGHNKIRPETKKVMEDKVKFLIYLSDIMDWEYDVNANYANFKGYRAWRKQYNGDLESVLFSTGKIHEFDKSSFMEWFDKLPSQARFRTKNKILYSKKKDSEEYKYQKFIPWIDEWSVYKANKQAEQRTLTEKVRQGLANDEDLAKLKEVTKEAKVTTGAITFESLYRDIQDDRIDKLKLESFINKINLPYNNLVIIDDSGSMAGRPFNIATFIAAICLCKNPDDDARNLIGMFNTDSYWYTCMDKQADSPNSFLRPQIAKTKAQPFVNPNISFYDNYMNIKRFCNAVFHNGCTRIDTIVKGLASAVEEDSSVLDYVRKYPIWTIISDGEFNNCRNPRESMKAMMDECEKLLGFKPFIIAIDVASWGRFSSAQISEFNDIDNMIYIPANLSQIEMLLTNFKDMETFDVYTPLNSLFKSNRYEIVRKYVE